MKKLILPLFLAVTALSFSQVPSYVPTNGLVGWWPFNGNANDESGNGFNGQLVYSSNGLTYTSDRFGNNIQALDFNSLGIPDQALAPYVDLTNTSSVAFNQEYSFNIWTKLGTNTQVAELINKGPDNNSFFSRFQGLNGFAFGNLSSYLNHNMTIETTQWHMYTYTRDNIGDGRLYVDGLLVATQTISAMAINSNTFSLGKMPSGGTNGSYYPYQGKMDDIGIWNRALTECEIQDLYYSQLNSATGISAGTDQTVCEGNDVTLTGAGGSNYQWNNSVVDGTPFTPTATQNYIVTAEDGNGCLGTDTVNVEVLLNTTATQTETALDSYTWPVNNQTYNQSGTYTAVIPNEAGCDSTITLDLTMQFTGIEELIQSEKELVKIVDLMGRETPFKLNTPLIFIYSDGTRERVMKLEE